MRAQVTISILLLLLGTTVVSAQTTISERDYLIPEVSGSIISHSVSPGSKGNEITLSLINQWGSEGGDSIVIWIPSYKPWLKGEPCPGVRFSPDQQTTSIPMPGIEKNVMFSFDISDTVARGRTDTIHFIMFTKTGKFLRKSIVLKNTLPSKFALLQNYPNPFNPSTTIEYDLPQPARIKLAVFDVLGRQIRILVDERKDAGYYQCVWDGKSQSGMPVSTGAYLFNLEGTGQNGSFHETRKMLLIR